MKQMIGRVPIPLSGVMLGCAALGNLLQSTSGALRWGFGILSTGLLVLLVLKLLLCFPAVRADMQNPIMASVSGTFPMGLMLLSVYYKPYLGMVSQVVWFFAIALHLALILWFTAKFILHPDIKKVFASYFIVYVGIGVAGVTAPAYSMTGLGTAAFWFGAVCLLPLLAVVGYRYVKHPSMPEPAQPLFCIFAAPASLCLTAYLQSVQNKSVGLVYVMAALAAILYVAVLVRLVPLLRLKFYPSYAAFTFPFVISATAFKQTNAFLTAAGAGLPFLSPVVTIQTVIATALVCYTVIRYGGFLLQKPKTPAPVSQP